jgi:hypothetical protein
MAKVLSAERYESTPLGVFPDGEYPGVWSGYVVEFSIAGFRFRLKTDTGVRGMNVPCVVKVESGAVTVS